MTISVYTLLTLAFSATPLTILLFWFYEKYVNKQSLDLSKSQAIVTPLIGTFAKDEMELKSIVFSNKKLTIENGEYLKLKEDRIEKEIERKDISNHCAINLTAIASAHCHFEKVALVEKAIENFYEKAKIDIHKEGDAFKIIQEISNPEKKKMTTVVAINRKTEEIYAFSKGNPLEMLKRCKRIHIDGKNVEMEAKIYKRLKRRIKKLNLLGEKIICFAYKPLPKKLYKNYSSQYTENDLVFLSMIGVGHRIFEKERGLISDLKKIDIKTIIIDCARERKVMALAKELQLVNSKHFEMINHQMLADINEKKLISILKKDKDYLFCEMEESDKSRIINALKELKLAPYQLTKNTKLSSIIDKFTTAKKNSNNLKQVINFNLASKGLVFLTQLTLVIYSSPISLSLLEILILDLGILLPMSFIIKKQKNNQKFFTANDVIFSSSIALILVFFSLASYKWYPGIYTNFNFETAKNLLLSVLIFFQIFFSLKIQSIEFLKQHKKLSIIPITILISTIILLPNTELNWLLAIISLALIILFYEIRITCYQILKKSLE